MEIRDPVHGSIHILPEEVPIITADFFKRLRGIKQLGFSEFVFPGATHTRFIHSLGVMHIGSLAFDKLLRHQLAHPEMAKLKETFKLACLLHDIGHAPLSHSTESVMPMLAELKIPQRFLVGRDKLENRQATHEDYTIKAIADSSFADSFKMVENQFGVNRKNIAELIVGQTEDEAYFTVEGINYFPILHQLVSSELDCDRMDYLLRDSYFCGVSYGNYDLDWLIDNLEVACSNDNQAFLGISERAVITFDDFLLSRYHMFVMVYFHYRAVCLEQLLMKFFNSGQGEYRIPADIEKYIEHDDHYLMRILRESTNPYAQAVVKNKIPSKIYESFNDAQLDTLNQAQELLQENGIDYIRSSSNGRLSKYYTADGRNERSSYMMKVVRNLQNGKKFYFNINEATDLFEKFSKSHTINRLHCDLEVMAKTPRTELLKIINS